MLVGEVQERLEALLREKAGELGLEIIALVINPDHVHLFVNARPEIAIHQVAFRLKGYTSRVLRQEFPHLRKMPSMWTSAYFASTAGNISNETVRRYIEAQSKK